jgi:hypothetical protein
MNQLAPDDPIRVDRLSVAWTSFVDLQYVRLSPEQSLFDPLLGDLRDEAAQHFVTHLADGEDEDVEQVRRATLWALNLPPASFRELVYRVRFPVPRFDPADIHRFVELLWARAWGGDWHVPGFDPDRYQVVG